MISRRPVLLTLAIATLSVASLPVLAASRKANPVRIFDTDNDGTLDLAEVKKAASALFAKLDRDHDG
ncbi:MAG TPA: calcium-binding protein, partial [Bradyrhizobium sp.]|nr:calcium-binding protein [Bradyrhizobium sp.]